MESKTYVFNPESGTSGTGSNGILAMLPALMQRQGVDPGLIALLNNRGNGNGWGEDIFAILLLFILMGNNGMGFFGGNRCMGSNGQGGVVPMLNNDANTAVIMRQFSAMALMFRAWLQPSTHQVTQSWLQSMA